MEAKLSYNSSNFRVRITLNGQVACDPLFDPHSFFAKAQGKFESLVQAGEITSYYIFQDDFIEFVKALRTAEDPSTMASFDLGYGARLIDLAVKEGRDTAIAQLSRIEAFQADVSLEEFWVNILLAVRSLGHANESLCSKTSIESAYYRWRKNALKTPFPIFIKKNIDPLKKSMSATINRSLKEAYIYVQDPGLFASKEGLKKIYDSAKGFSSKVKGQLPEAEFLNRELMSALKNEAGSGAALGIGLPRVFIISMETARRDSVPANSSQKGALKPKNSFFRIEYARNNLIARISAVSPSLTEPGFKLTAEQLVAEVQKHGIVCGYDQHIPRLLKMIEGKQDIKNQLVAEGREPTGGRRPYLHETYKDGVDEGGEDEDMDMREAQNRNTIDPGQVIAEVRFADGRPGMDVFGNELHITPEDKDYKVRLGSNVERDALGRVVALIHGMPTVIGNLVDVSPVFVHKGDINLSSGNLDFDGAAVIQGNVESGAIISVTDHLTVTGTIGQASVKVGGNLIVKGGVVSTKKGLIQVGGKLVAGFVENSKVIVAGDMIVSQSVMNSDVIVGGKLKIISPKSGMVGGGLISVRDRLITGNLGFDEGRNTVCLIGADFVAERKIAINETRLQRLNDMEEQANKQYQELQSNKSAAKDKVSEFRKKLDRLGLLKRKIERKLKALHKDLTWNKNGLIVVQNIASTNVDLTIGGRSIVLKEEVREVMITYHKIRDGRINPIDFLIDFENKIARDYAS